mmetsp:Transcript_35521/g.78845  ORF Transcript_35521/g.78845 Transcript_35521/m.78845 type:complete len:406 (+) Transcript_35521:80-1297(+)
MSNRVDNPTVSFLSYDDAVVFPSVPIRSYTTDKYLETVSKLIRAEYNAFLREAQPAPIKLVLKRRTTGSTDETRKELLTVAALWKAGDMGKGLKELDRHLIVYNQRFYRCETKNSVMTLVGPGDAHAYDGTLPRMRDDDMPDMFRTEEACDAFDLGYIGDAMSEYKCCSALLDLPAEQRPILLSSLCQPDRRRRVAYCRDPISPDVPLDPVQLSALEGMKFDIEGIQGPPGTGKSTLVYHIVNSFLGKNTISLATCVQNKAVDAIAEKLATGQIGFFVVGNEDRLGLFAKMWTLDAQMYRKPGVMGAAEAHERKEGEWRSVKDIVEGNVNIHKFMFPGRGSATAQRVRQLARERQQLWMALKRAERQARDEILSSARVLLCTVAAAGAVVNTHSQLCAFVSGHHA